MGPKRYEVVISGISGKFPECETVEELEYKLMNKEDVITFDDRKWPPGTLEVPSGCGKYKTPISLDNTLFRVSNHLLNVQDPITNQCLKSSLEAICDAGINPEVLRGSNTPVIIASFISEAEYCHFGSDQYLGLLGIAKTMQANRVSFFLGLKGPSFSIDATWNGGLQAIQIAYDSISTGECSSAIVGACSTIYGPELSYYYQAMGKLNNDGKTKCFSADADGYTRSEASTLLFLQRAEDAKRSYGTITGLHLKDFGIRNTGFSDFSSEIYKSLLREAYNFAHVDPMEIRYIEADGGASKEMEQQVVTIDSILRKLNYRCNMVCIGSGGEPVCELRKADSLPSLAISCQSHQMVPSAVFPLLDRYVQTSGDSVVIFLEDDIPNNETTGYLERIPKDHNELITLYKKSVKKARFVEIMTSCPQYKYSKDLLPIFVIPSLKPNEMDKLTSRFFYPTFEARFPQDIKDIEAIAKHLFEDLKRFKLNVFTLITNDWGGAIGLQLAKYLEDDGKIVLLAMLNSSPQSVQSWVADLLQMGDVNLILKYVKVPYKIKKKLHQLTNWEEEVNIALENSALDEIEREGVRNGLNIMRNSLMAVMKFRANGGKFRGKYFMYQPKVSNQMDHYKMMQLCERKPEISLCSAWNNQEMLDDPEMAIKINSLIPYEYKTEAHGVNCEVFGNYTKQGLRVNLA